MSSIKQSNKTHKFKIYWKLSSLTHRWQQSAFIIHADLSENQLISEDLDMQFFKNLDTQFLKNLNMKSEDLDMKFKNLNMKFENLDMKSEHLNIQSAEN